MPFFNELRFDDSGRLWIADYVPSRWPCIGSRGEGVYAFYMNYAFYVFRGVRGRDR